MKKNIGNVLALYPTPVVVVGTEVNGKVNWLLVAHVGIIGMTKSCSVCLRSITPMKG